MKIAAILREHYEKSPALLRKCFTKNVACWGDVNRILFCWDARDGNIEIRHIDKVDRSEYLEPYDDLKSRKTRVNRARLYSHLRAGATLILNRLDLHSPEIALLSAEISRYFGEKTVANGYVSFGAESAFGKHWDTHDVVAVQLIGRKRWRIYEPTFQSPMAEQASRDHKESCPSLPILDLILEEGDGLYIPRGWWHEAMPEEAHETFHVAIGVHAARVRDYIDWISNEVLNDEIEFRKTLGNETSTEMNLSDAAKKFSSLFLSDVIIERFRKFYREKERSASPFSIEICSMTAGLDINEEGFLLINSPYIQHHKAGAPIHVNSYELSPDARIANIIQTLLSGPAIQVGELMQKSQTENSFTFEILAKLIAEDIISYVRPNNPR